MWDFCRPEKSVFYRIFLLLSVVLAGMIVTYILFSLALYIQSGLNLTVVNEQLSKINEDVNLLRILQITQSFCLFIIPPFILSRLYKEKTYDFLHLKMPEIKSVFVGMFSMVFMMPIINILVKWNTGLKLPDFLKGIEVWMRESESAAEKITQLMLQGTTWGDLFINLFIVAVLAGIGEELFFRGLLQSILVKGCKNSSSQQNRRKQDWSMHATIWGVAFIFSAIHLQFFGFFPRMILGAWFGYLLWWSGSIWIPVIAHFTNNALSTIAVFSENRGILTRDPDQLGLNDTWWVTFFSIIILLRCIVYFKQLKIKRYKIL